MRLGQLARKLGLRPAEIVDFLAARQIPIDENANTKLPDDQLALILQQFAPGQAEAISAELDDLPDLDAHKTSEAKEVVNENSKTIDPSSEIPTNELKAVEVELIKAPKVELPGLKVVGKIELPEIKKKVTSAENVEFASPDAAPENGKQPREEYRRDPRRRERSNQSRINPIALQREREERDAEKKREAEAEREKEKRKEHYHKKVKTAPPTKRVRMVEEPLEEFTAAELKEAPKTLWGKFKKWMKS